MTPKAEQDQYGFSNLEGDLESPFLNEESFTPESESNWDAQFSLLEAESPFLHAFAETPSPAFAPAPYAEAFGGEYEVDAPVADEDFEVQWEDGLQEWYGAAIESEVFGSNDMDGVANHFAMPFRWICRLDIEYEVTPWNTTRKLRGTGRGTGILISPCHILTASHNITTYDPAGKNFLRATRISVTAAHDGSNSPPVATVEANMTNLRMHPFWRVADRVDGNGNSNGAGEVATNRYDYALITLARPIDQDAISGGKLGYWSRQGSGGVALFERLDPNILRSNTVSVTGYGYDDCVRDVRQARSKPAIPLGSQLTASGQITLIWEGTPKYVGRSMAHNVDTCGGQSGGPVWLKRDEKFYLVGIHTSGVGLTGGGRTNHAVRVTAEVITQVNSWMAQLPCPVPRAGADREGPVEGKALYHIGELDDAELYDAEFDDAEFDDAEFDDAELYGDMYEEEDGDEEFAYAAREDFSDEEESELYLEAFAMREAPAVDEGFFTELEEQENGSSSLRDRIVEVAKREWEKWDKGMKVETESAVTDFLQEYHRVGVDRTVSRRDLQSIAWHRKHPWSAVFISYVMKSAGAGDTFAYRSAHTGYVAAAKKNALAGDASKFQAFEITAVKPEVGDLVCRDRSPDPGKLPCSGTNFANVDKGGISHCDIVVEVHPDYIVIMGGNTAQGFPHKGLEKNTVGQRKIKLNAQGYVIAQQSKNSCKYFAIVKPPGTAASGSTGSGSALPAWLTERVKSGLLTLQAAWAILTGQRDVGTLTNMIFYARHPELPAGYKIQKQDTQLAASWKRIRDEVVKPILQRLAANAASGVAHGVAQSPGPSAPPAGAGTSYSEVSKSVSITGGGWGGWKGRQAKATAFIAPNVIRDKYDLAVAVAAMVETGGSFDKVQMYDKGILSWGIKQWTLHRGSLQKLLGFIKIRLAESGQASWTELFPNIDIQSNRILANGTSYATPTSDDDSADLALRRVFRGNSRPGEFDKDTMDRWLGIFAQAGRHPIIQKLQFEYAVKSLVNNLNLNLGKVLRGRKEIKESEVQNYRRIGDYVENSPLALTLFNGMETQNPKWTYLYLKRIVDLFAGTNKTYNTSLWPSNWQEKFAIELKNAFEASGVACWGKEALKKPACKGRTSRTEKIMNAYGELSRKK